MDFDFNEEIKPFCWIDNDECTRVTLDTRKLYLKDVFDTRKDDGAEGNGYDWTALAEVFLDEKFDITLQDDIEFDPEASMFCAYSDSANVLKKFILSFKDICENHEEIIDLFSRAELD